MGLFATWRHIKRLREIEDRCDALERQVAALDREWSEVSEDLRIRLAKISKRSLKLERLEQHEAGGNGERPEQHEDVPPEAGRLGLTAGQIQAQREIMARRRGLGGV